MDLERKVDMMGFRVLGHSTRTYGGKGPKVLSPRGLIPLFIKRLFFRPENGFLGQIGSSDR